jgi:radical SAM enzyme (TIGR01210 family)
MSSPAGAVSGLAYPDGAVERDRWILSHRSERQVGDAYRPYACNLEEERAGSGEVVSVATVFLTNRECPWRCLMCDLWKRSLLETVPGGAIPTQIDRALEWLNARSQNPLLSRSTPVARHIKLYNSGSFFDPRSVPPEDHSAIAQRVCGFERVIVECHPALIGETTVCFRDLLRTQAAKQDRNLRGLPELEVAMGLETAHPQVLEKLNKRMPLELFARAGAFLREHGIAVRVFILVQPPFMSEADALPWAERSLDFAFDSGAEVAVLIPTRSGNGALEALARQGSYSPPKLSILEAALDYGLRQRRGRVFADLWNLEQFADCALCFPARAARLTKINLQQQPLPAVRCARCDAPRA